MQMKVLSGSVLDMQRIMKVLQLMSGSFSKCPHTKKQKQKKH